MYGHRMADEEREPAAAASEWWAPRWKGQKGRLEVWYATATDDETGTGLWVHGETVAGTDDGSGVASHGWVALFPPDAGPVWQRTESVPEATTQTAAEGEPGFCADDLRIDPTGTEGHTADLSWEIDWDASDQQPLATFPRWAWERELLPGAQVLPAPSMPVSGWVDHDGQRHRINGTGAVARIYGHGSAQRWAWLHADLGNGDLVEVVTAVSRRSGLSKLAPITFLRMRVDGYDWPATRIASWGLRTTLGLPQWSVKGRTQGFEVSIEVTQPADRCVEIEYTDPDGSTATCTNTERADLALSVRSQSGTERTWRLDGTAHAEVGLRP